MAKRANTFRKDVLLHTRLKKRPHWKKQIGQFIKSHDAASHHNLFQRNWKLVYLLRKDEVFLSLQACRVRIKKDGTMGEVLAIRDLDVDNALHFDHNDRLALFRITSTLEFTLWRNPEPDQTFSPSSEWNPSEVVFSDMFRLLAGKELYFTADGVTLGQRIEVATEPAEIVFLYQEDSVEDVLTANLITKKGPTPFEANAEILLNQPLWILNGSTLIEIPHRNGRHLHSFEQSGWQIRLPVTQRELMRRQYLPRLLEQYSIQGVSINVEELTCTPRPQLYLEERSGELLIHLKFSYGGYEVPSDNDHPHLVVPSPDTAVYFRIPRSPEFELNSRRLLLETNTEEDHPETFIVRRDPLSWLTDKLPELAQSGFDVFGEEELRTLKVQKRPSTHATISADMDWFDIKMRIHFDGTEVSYEDFYKAVMNRKRFVRLADGTTGLIPQEWIEKFKRAFTLTTADEHAWRFSRIHLSLIDELSQDIIVDDAKGTFTDLRRKLSSFDSIIEQKIPKNFHATLRPYQKAGYDWLHFLKGFGFSGCLADDMGLGKTVQALALLRHEYNNGAEHPSLVVVPTSLVFNWFNEAHRFTPTLRVLNHTGTQRLRSDDAFQSHDIILTTYGTIRRDIERLKNIQFHYIILDESQSVKNPTSQTAKSVRQLKGLHRLALTGTPVENNLIDLWSQFAFLQPGLLGSQHSFTEQFVKPIERHHDELAAESLRVLIYPFLLRRTKDIVAEDLPPKVEAITYCDMDKAQQSLYNEVRDRYRNSILASIDRIGLNKSRFKVLEGLMKLRELCCHPTLIDTESRATSGKYEVWKTMLEEILAEGHKVLVFSQFVRMLRVLSTHCDDLGIDYEYLDGQTRDREERVERFQNDDAVKVFLISLRAGGTGLNLTSADYVIHYDPWWNPAVEAQATDRTHRIGQDRKVFSYKLITRATVEEKVLELQERKKSLVKSIITTENGFVKSLTKKDIEGLFS